MKAKILLALAFCSNTLAIATEVVVGQSLDRRAYSNCDVTHALNVLKGLSGTGESFCCSLLHERTRPTKTVSATFQITITEKCAVTTEITTIKATFTTVIYGTTITLPQLTKTEYSSSVLVPSGQSRIINRRTAQPRAQNSTPSALSTCAPSSLSTACSSLLRPTTTITKSTTYTTTECAKTVHTTTTTTRQTITKTIPFLVTPPPIIINSPGVLTTTVPANCAGPSYSTNEGTVGGDSDFFPQYPYQPRTLVECCVACYAVPNCIASAYDPDADDCEFLIRGGLSSGFGVSDTCPLGIEDFEFDTPPPGTDGYILPGPCGR